ncbi:MAG: hypothetical protein NPIRA04_34900 [Nitrospirales bacterium]|nr:MAG: hypothetical protein NPIRA04_34900 [Nitrospirales bacterium]
MTVGGLGSLIAAFVFLEYLFVITLQSPLELSNLAEDVSDDTGKVTLNLFILLLEYVGMAVGYAIGLCTLAVA